MNKPELLFVYDMQDTSKWMDGLWCALNLLEEDFKVNKLNLYDRQPDNAAGFDFVLGWGAFNSRVDHFMQKLTNQKKGLCIGGNTYPPAGADSYDVLFYETKWYRPEISFHKNIVHAFGVNTDIYNNINIPVPILWDYIGVGSFSSWKRWPLMLEKPGNRLIIGEYQVNNEEESLGIVKGLVKGNVMVSNMINPYDLSMLLQSARTLYMPSSVLGGGERAVLEARACGITVEIEDDNPKLKELLDCEIYDHKYYATQLKKGILSCL